MLDNIGNRIKGLARLLFLVGVVCSGVGMIGMWITGTGLRDNAGGFTIFLVGLLIGAVGCLVSWTALCLISGFGQLVEDTQAIRHNAEDAQYCMENLRRMAEEFRRADKHARPQGDE